MIAALALHLALIATAEASASPAAAPSPAASASDAVPPAPAVSAVLLGPGSSRMRFTPLPMPSDAARIQNSGSTNLSGYEIVVSPSGDATAMAEGATHTVKLAKDVVTKFFADLSAAAPLTVVAPVGCMKSASFGSSTSISWHGTTSGDLSCGRSARSSELEADIHAIVNDANVVPHVRNRRPML